MENSKQTNGSAIYFDDVVIERDNFRVCKGGRQKSLTPRAFDVLVYLIERRGRVVEKQEIFEAIWKETFVTDNALMRAVKEIRRELGDDANAPHYVETVHKRGYRFVAEVSEHEEPSNPPAAEARNATELNIPDYKLRTTNQTPANENRIQNPKSKIQNRQWLWILPVMLLTIGAIAFWFFGSRAPKQIGSVAVLPFKNDSGNADIEYLSDGITESIINNLSQLSNLKVMSRNSAFRFKENQSDTRNIASQLGVESLVTGDIRHLGDRLVINVRLIDATDDSQIWGSQYVKNSGDLIAAQNEIALAIVDNLRRKLTNAERRRLDKNDTKNPEAYQLCLKGRYYLLKLTPPEMKKSIEFFRQAIDADPGYALAYVNLADAYRLLSITGEMPPNEGFPKAKAALSRALEIDETLAEARDSQGSVKFWFDWDWQGAETEFRRAAELAPHNAKARPSYAHFLSNMGRFDEALAEIGKAREQDPLSLTANSLEGLFLFYAGRDAEAIARLEKTFEIDPKFWLAHINLAKVYIRQNKFDEALRELNIVKQFSAGNTEAISLTGYTLAVSGKRREAEAALDELKKMAAQKYVPSYHIAVICGGLDERDETFDWLEKAFAERDVYLSFIKVDPKWNNLRSDSRFVSLLKRMNLE